MSLLKVGKVAFGEVEGLIAYMRSKGLLASSMTCRR